MLHVQCLNSGVSAYVDCVCPNLGHDPMGALVPGHHQDCPMADLGAAVSCPPGSGCCQLAHSHDAAANACAGDHGGAACPVPGSCGLWAGVSANDRHPIAGADPGPCPGGHCHKDVPGCMVCHPVIVTVMPGSAVLQPVTG